MRNIEAMDYDDLLSLHNNIITEEEMGEVEDHHLVTWFELIGRTEEHKGCYWYEVQIKHPQEDSDLSRIISLYVDVTSRIN